jgi:HK97 family phage prohead protease
MEYQGRTVMDLAGFKDLVKAGETPDNVVIQKDIETKIDKSSGRSVSFTISSQNPDRMKDVIDVNGWDLTNFKKNPVVLWSHDYRGLPIGKATSIRRDKKNGVLRATAEFVPSDTPVVGPMAEAVLQMLKGGFLNATSVGFQPMETSFDEERGGFNFAKAELLEFSVVPVPANADALQDDFLGQVRAAGIDTEPIVAWAKSIMAQNDDGEEELVAATKTEPLETEVTVKVELSDELKALVERLDAEPEVEPFLEVDFDPEMRIELAEELDEDTLPVEAEDINTLVKEAVLNAIRETATSKAEAAVNALRGRVD